MADNNVIDSLELQVRASANSAISSLGKLQTHLRHTAKAVGTLASAQKTLSNMKTDTKGLTNFINAISKLSSVDTSKFEAKTLTDIAVGMKRIAAVGDVSSSANKLTASVAKIADSGDKARKASEALPSLSAALREIGKVEVKDDKLVRLANALNRMANAKVNSENVASLNSMALSLGSLASTGDERGMSRFVNSMIRLSDVNFKDFDASKFESLKSVLEKMASVDNISAGITKLMTALAKLANAGDKTEQSAEALPRLGSALREVMQGITSAGALPSELNAFVSSVAQLANAGNKTGTTADQLGVLGTAIKNFISDLRQAPEVSTSVLEITKSLGQIASSGGKVGTASKSISKSITTLGNGSKSATSRLSDLGDVVDSLGSIFNRVGGYVKVGAQKIVNSLKSIRNAGNGLQTATQSIKNMIGAMIGFRGITGLASVIKETMELGANLTEIDHIVESVFGDMAGYVDSWAKNAITSFGIAEHSAKQYAGTLSSMFQASGIGYKEAGKMAMDLVGLAGDLSAFYNEDTETSYEKIKSGLSGMVRPLRAYGIDLSAASLEEFRLAQGIQTSYSAMTQAEKVMLRYQYLMSNTTTQQGDFQRTAYSTANAMRTLKAYVQAVQTQIGAGLGSAIRHVIVWLNSLMKTVLKAATAFATFMQTIFGKYKGGASGIAMDSLADSVDYADDLGGAADNAASGLGDAADNAKQLKKDLSVLPFDELNQLNKDREAASSGSGSGGSGVGDVGAGLGEGLLDWGDLLEGSDAGNLPDAINEWAKRVKRAFERHDWDGLGFELADGINKGIRKVYDILDPRIVKKKVTPFIDAFTQTLNSFARNLNFNLIGRTIGRGINDIVYILNRTITGIDWRQIGSKLSSGLNGLVNEVDFRSVGELLGNKFMIVWNILEGFVHDFDWVLLGKRLGDGVNGINSAISWSTVADALTTGLNGAFDALREFASNVHWIDLAQNIVDGINTAITNFNWYENGKSLGMFLENLLDALIKIIDETDWEGFGAGLAVALQQLPWGKLLRVVGKVIVDVIGGILRGLASTPAGMFAEALVGALAVYKFSKSDVGRFVSGFCKVLTGATPKGLIANAFSKLFSSGLSSVSIAGQFGAITLAIGGAVAAIYGLTRAVDALQGGNGIITEAGESLERYIEEFGRTGELSSEQVDQLWHSIEEMEGKGYSAEEMAREIIPQLLEMGVSSGTAAEMAERLAASHETSTEAMSHVLDVAKEVTREMPSVGTSASESFDKIKNAIYDLRDASGDYSGRYDEIVRQLTESQGTFTDTQDVYLATMNIMESLGLSTEDLKIKLESMGITYDETAGRIIDTDTEIIGATEILEGKISGGYEGIKSAVVNSMQGIKSELQDAVQQTIDTANSNAEALDEWQQKVSEFHDNVSRSLQGVGESWGSIDVEQGNALDQLIGNLTQANADMTTAITNMEALNNSGLDRATVQAILAQVDPSSQAMTDLIAHMQADDATWQTFHDNLKTNMDMQADIQETIDQMTTDFAEQIKPACVTIGEDFKTEFGNIGGFIVEGLGDGIQENTEDAANQLRTLAQNLQQAYKTEDQIGSPSKVYYEFGKNDVEGLANGVRNNKSIVTNVLKELADRMKETLDKLPSEIESIGTKIAKGFATGINTGADIKGLISEIDSTLRTGLGAIDLYNTGNGVGVTLSNGLRTGVNTEGLVSEIRSALQTGFGGIDLYQTGVGIGANLASGIANGLMSIHIPTPYMWVSLLEYVDLGGAGMYIPHFSVGWYRKGGLFMGGDGQMIGIAENGRDEAVLPLEDQRAMKRIGSAIAEAGGGGMGMSDQLVDRIADRLADVILMSKDEPDPIFNIEVRTENDEVLARAVTRGQQKLDYRNNPTPSYGY